MINRVELHRMPDCTAEGAEEKIFLGISIQPDCGAFLQEDKQGEKHCNEITEKAFLHGRQVARKPHEQIHQSEKEG